MAAEIDLLDLGVTADFITSPAFVSSHFTHTIASDEAEAVGEGTLSDTLSDTI